MTETNSLSRLEDRGISTPTVTFTCNECGGNLLFNEGDTIAECDSCGRRQPIPSSKDAHLRALFVRANDLRRRNAFDKAAGIYEGILAEDATQAEAYWGLLLCEYGIEYVEDPATHERIPTCHRASYANLLENPNCKGALDHADAAGKPLYAAEARRLEDLRKAVVDKSRHVEPVDVFICYKESDEAGNRTLDSELVGRLYDRLTEAGWRVFFARESLKEHLGAEYEPLIFAALQTAKVMLVVATEAAHLNATWVKNEWSRYLALMREDPKTARRFTACLKGMDEEELPGDFLRYEYTDLSEPGAEDDLIRSLKRFFQKAPPATPAATPSSKSVESLMKRGKLELSFRNFQEAQKAFSQVLDTNPEYAEAYLGALMAKYECENRERLLEKCLRLPECPPQFPAEKALKSFRKHWNLADISISSLERFGSLANPNFTFECLREGQEGVRQLASDAQVSLQEAEALKAVGREALWDLQRICREIETQRKIWAEQNINDSTSGEAILKNSYFRAALRFATGELKAWLEAIPVERERQERKAREEYKRKEREAREERERQEREAREERKRRERERLETERRERLRQSRQTEVTRCLRQAVQEELEAWCAGHNLALNAMRYVCAGRSRVAVLHPATATTFAARVCDLLVPDARPSSLRDVDFAMLQAAGDNWVTLRLNGDLGIAPSLSAKPRLCPTGTIAIESLTATDDSVFVLDDHGVVFVLSLREKPKKAKWKRLCNLRQGHRRLVAGSRYLATITDEGDCCVIGHDGKVVHFPNAPKRAQMVAFGEKWILWLEKYGTLQCDGDVPEAVRQWPKLLAIASGDGHVVGLDCKGKVLAAGDNDAGQCNVQDWEPCFAVFAAGKYTLALSRKGNVLCTNPTVRKAYANLHLTPDTWKRLKGILNIRTATLGTDIERQLTSCEQKLWSLQQKSAAQPTAR